MDDVTVSAARICAMGEVIPAEKPWLDPARPGAKKPAEVIEGEAGLEVGAWGALTPLGDKFRDVVELVLADCPGWHDIRFVVLGGPTAVVEWPDGGKSLYALDTDETAEQVVEHLRRQRG